MTMASVLFVLFTRPLGIEPEFNMDPTGRLKAIVIPGLTINQDEIQ